MERWREKLRNEDGQRTLSLARHLDTDEWCAWLRAFYTREDPDAPYPSDLDPAPLFAEVWEAIPEEAPRRRLTEAILREFQTSLSQRPGSAGYIGFLLYLMIKLPLPDFPTQSVKRAINTRWSGELTSDEGIPLRALLYQALFARSTPTGTELHRMLEDRETVHLAFRAIREKGLGEAVEALPVVSRTLDQDTDTFFLSVHIKAIVEQYGKTEFGTQLENTGALHEDPLGQRLRPLLKQLGIDVWRTKEEPRGRTAKDLSPTIITEIFERTIAGFQGPRLRRPPNKEYSSVWY